MIDSQLLHFLLGAPLFQPERIVAGRRVYVYMLTFGRGRLVHCDDRGDVCDQW